MPQCVHVTSAVTEEAGSSRAVINIRMSGPRTLSGMQVMQQRIGIRIDPLCPTTCIIVVLFLHLKSGVNEEEDKLEIGARRTYRIGNSMQAAPQSDRTIQRALHTHTHQPCSSSSVQQTPVMHAILKPTPPGTGIASRICIGGQTRNQQLARPLGTKRSLRSCTNSAPQLCVCGCVQLADASRRSLEPVRSQLKTGVACSCHHVVFEGRKGCEGVVLFCLLGCFPEMERGDGTHSHMQQAR